MPPKLPELVRRARRLATERDRLVQELAREWATALRGQGFSARDLEELWAGLTEEAVRRLLQTDARNVGAEAIRHEAREVIARVRTRVQTVLRALPGVDAVVTRVEGNPAVASFPRRRLTEVARDVLAAERRRVLEGAAAAASPERLAERVVARLSERGAFSLSRVVNGTGVVLHTNLGRALLSSLARERLAATAAGYSNLEIDVARKVRGSRYTHVDPLLQRLTGAEASLVVNNCASAVLLALESL